MSSWLNKSQKIVAFIMVLIVVFTAGVFTGRYVQKRDQLALAAGAGEQVIETQDDLLITNGDVGTVSDDSVSDNTVPLPQVSDNQATVSENTEVDTGSGQSVSGNESGAVKPVLIQGYQETTEKLTLAQRAAIRSSFEETTAINQQDQAVIAASTLDFSNMKIAFLGDSITAGVNGSTPYPYLVKELLGVEEVYNLGQGGSTIATIDGSAAMTERCNDIPTDADIIIVMGGTNDNFYQPSWKFGFMTWETKGEGTFCGELQLLMKKFKWSYPNAKVLFLTPPSNSKIDELRAKDKSLQDQSVYAEAINYIGAEQGIEVIDLYNMNFLNSHDATVRTTWMNDEVHPNSYGNKILAEKVAAEIIKRYQMP